MHFASDNASGVAPEVLDALAQANHGYALGYGNDDWTREVERRMAEIFEHEVAVFLCSTGTASNAIAIAHVTPPWGGVLCHAESHIMTDECGAPEFYGGGLKLIGKPGEVLDRRRDFRRIDPGDHFLYLAERLVEAGREAKLDVGAFRRLIGGDCHAGHGRCGARLQERSS